MKKIIIASLFSTLLLFGAGGFQVTAEEVDPTAPGVVDPTDPETEPGTPTDPVEPGTEPGTPTDPVDPGTEPDTPTEPVDPGTNPSTPTDPVDPGTNPSTPTDPVDPGTNPSTPTDPVEPGTNPSTPTDPVDPGTNPSTPTEPVDPGTDPKQPEKPNKPIQPTDPVEQPKPIDTNPVEQPFTTDAGHTIIAVEDSKPIIQLADGTTKKVEAKEIGATVQKDGTVAVKGTDGKLKVLPKTGEKEAISLSIMGGLITLVSSYILSKKKRV